MTHEIKLQVSLGSYALAASALGLASASASAEATDAGLLGPVFPIVVDSSDDFGVDFDINADGQDDVRIRYTSDYGGGFEMQPLDRVDSENEAIGYRYKPSFDTGAGIARYDVRVTPRYDPGEWVDQTTEYVDYACYCGLMLDTPFRDGYHPFVDRPGFVAMRLQPVSGGGPTPAKQLAYLEIVVSNDSQVLHVLSAGFDDTGASRIQMPQTVTPPPAP